MHTLSRSLIFSALASAALLLFGCDGTPPPHATAPKVTYMPLAAQVVTLTTELPGRTSAFMISEVRPQVNGIIKERLFVEGSDVKEGQVLYQIDPALYQATYDSANANLAKAEANAKAARLLAERYASVVRVNAVSKQEYDNAVASYGQAQAEVAAAKATLDTARINLDYTKVTAPVAGRIGVSDVTPGALVTQNQPKALTTVQQIDKMYVDVTQSSSDLLALKRAFAEGRLKSSGADAVRVRLKLEDGSLYTQNVPKKDAQGNTQTDPTTGKPVMEAIPVIGALQFSDVTVDPSTGAITIRALFSNPEGILLPNMYVRAILEEGVSDTALLIPQKAMSRDTRGRPQARVLVKNATIKDIPDIYNVEVRTITINRSVGNFWMVSDGLASGDLLLVDGVQKARPGFPVNASLATPESIGENPAASSAGGKNAPRKSGEITPPEGKK